MESLIFEDFRDKINVDKKISILYTWNAAEVPKDVSKESCIQVFKDGTNSSKSQYFETIWEWQETE